MRIPLPARLTAVAVMALSLSVRANAEVWTLDHAVRTALEHSPDARIARLRIDGADALIEQARSAWMPQLSLSGRYTETNSPMMAFGSILNQRAFGPTIDFNHPGTIDDLNVAGTIAYNLYGGGRPTAGLQAAKAGARAAQFDLKAARHELGVEVVKAYLNVRKAREAVVALRAGVDAYDAAVKVARARFEAGSLLKADLLSLEVQRSQTREMLVAARHGAQLAAHAFYYVLGIREQPGAILEFQPHDPALAAMTDPKTRDVSLRPELEGVKERVRAAEAMVRAARGARRPVVNAFASAQADKGYQTGRDANSWMAGVTVDMNVFDGGLTAGKIRLAKAELAQAQEMERKLELGLDLQVQQASQALDDARERLSVSAQSVAQAQESASLTRARFDKGDLLTADLIGVESRLIEARMRRFVAEADERQAVAELRNAVGYAPVEITQSHP